MRIALIGGGPSAIALYLELASTIGSRLTSITVFDPKGVLNSLSFNTETDVLLSNTSAGLTSILSRNPLDFLTWLRERHPGQVTPKSFLPRRLFRKYALSRFSAAKEYLDCFSCPTELVSEEVTDVRGLGSGAFRVITNQGTAGPYDAVVLATGPVFQEPFPDLTGEQGYVNNPYPESQLLAEIEEGGRVLILGSKLTATDAALSILANTERTKILLASSSGVFPAVRNQTLLYPTGAFDVRRLVQSRPPSLLRAAEMAALSDLRRLSPPGKPGRIYPSDVFERLMCDIENCETGRARWQQAIVPIVNGINELWPQLTFEEQKKMAGRHRTFTSRFITALPIENAKKIAAAMQVGRLTVRKVPRTPAFQRTPAGKFEGRGALAGLDFDTVVNATGLAPLGFREQAPYRNLLARRNLLNDHGGLEVDVRSMRLTGAGLNTRIYAMGPAVTGSLYITSYLPGSLVQASGIAADIAEASCRLAS